MPAPVIRLEDVRRSFEGKAVLRGVTACAEPGRLIGLLGRNGEGKTTLVRILLDLLTADSGRVEVLGLSPDGSGRIRSRVGWVPERPVFPEYLDVDGVLALRRGCFSKWDEARAERLCERMSLDPRTPVKGASKGTLAKLAWVCALAHDPELFVLDEPTSGLDAVVRAAILREVVPDLLSRGKTLLVANHHMEELAGRLDELWTLRGGALETRSAAWLRREPDPSAALARWLAPGAGA
jgi:ABC-2 type transport system ATP-binding protein